MIRFTTVLAVLGVFAAIGIAEACAQGPPPAPLKPLVRVVDLNLSEPTTVELGNGQQVEVTLLDLKETRDPIRQAVRSALVTVQVDGETITLESGMYNLPRRVAGVQIDCSITKGYNSNGTPSFWGLDKDARLRLWPQDSPLVRPGSLIYPVDQRWFATRTWFDNEPVDGGTQVLPKIYYHSGLDIGGSERLVKVMAATDAVVVSSGEDVLPKYLLEGGASAKYGQGESPVAPRSDVVYLKDGRGWFYRYSHLHKINDAIRPGRTIKQGTEIGLLGKKGSSGGWSHLHFEIKGRQPSGKWGTQAGYAFLWEAYRNQYKPQLVANTRRKSFLVAGGNATLDGSKSYSATDSIQDYEWTFSDRTTASGPRVTRSSHVSAARRLPRPRGAEPEGRRHRDCTSVLRPNRNVLRIILAEDARLPFLCYRMCRTRWMMPAADQLITMPCSHIFHGYPTPCSLAFSLQFAHIGRVCWRAETEFRSDLYRQVCPVDSRRLL